MACLEPLADKLYAETMKFLENHVNQELTKVILFIIEYYDLVASKKWVNC